MENKLTTRSNRFDECLKELDTESQLVLLQYVNRIADALANGGGVMSAKEVVYQLAFTGLYKEQKSRYQVFNEKIAKLINDFQQEMK